jgi:hypothetical protein
MSLVAVQSLPWPDYMFRTTGKAAEEFQMYLAEGSRYPEEAADSLKVYTIESNASST